jgi:hypothetical protein
MKVKLSVALNEDKDTTYGWYLYGYIVQEKGVISKYSTDTALVNILNIGLKEYRSILEEHGAVILANGRTCFPKREMAQSVIPIIERLITN